MALTLCGFGADRGLRTIRYCTVNCRSIAVWCLLFYPRMVLARIRSHYMLTSLLHSSYCIITRCIKHCVYTIIMSFVTNKGGGRCQEYHRRVSPHASRHLSHPGQLSA